MKRLAFTVPYLPQRVLSSNAGARSRRDPWSVANAVGLLKGQVMDELVGRRDLPRFETARASVTLRHTNRKPKAEECGPCRELMGSGDFPSWALPDDRSKPIKCCHYRPRDVGNIGGQVIKPVLDALTWREVWEDDDWTHLVEVRLRIERVSELAAEGLVVEVEEA